MRRRSVRIRMGPPDLGRQIPESCDEPLGPAQELHVSDLPGNLKRIPELKRVKREKIISEMICKRSIYPIWPSTFYPTLKQFSYLFVYGKRCWVDSLTRSFPASRAALSEGDLAGLDSGTPEHCAMNVAYDSRDGNDGT